MADSVYRNYAKTEAALGARKGLMQAGPAAAAIAGAVGSVSPSWGAAAYAVGGAATAAWTAARAAWAAYRSPRQSITDIKQTLNTGDKALQTPEGLRNLGKSLRSAGRNASRHAGAAQRVREAETSAGAARARLSQVQGRPSAPRQEGRSAPTQGR